LDYPSFKNFLVSDRNFLVENSQLQKELKCKREEEVTRRLRKIRETCETCLHEHDMDTSQEVVSDALGEALIEARLPFLRAYPHRVARCFAGCVSPLHRGSASVAVLPAQAFERWPVTVTPETNDEQMEIRLSAVREFHGALQRTIHFAIRSDRSKAIREGWWVQRSSSVRSSSVEFEELQDAVRAEDELSKCACPGERVAHYLRMKSRSNNEAFERE
jgi:hypothetical protein